MLNMVKRLVREEEGQGMAEYGLILALIACVVIVALKAIGTNINTKFGEVEDALSGTTTP